jgi:hypothetical protein
LADELRVLPRDQQDLPETFLGEMAAFRDDLLEAEGDPQDRVVPGKAAILAIVDALVRQIKRREQPHGPSKIPEAERVRLLRQPLEFTVRFGRNQIGKAMEKLRFLQRQVVQKRRERHRHNFARGSCFSIQLSSQKKRREHMQCSRRFV